MNKVHDIREAIGFKPGSGAYEYLVNAPCSMVLTDRIRGLKNLHDIESIVFTMRIALYNKDYMHICNRMLLIHVLQIIEYFGEELIKNTLSVFYNIELEGVKINEAI